MTRRKSLITAILFAVAAIMFVIFVKVSMGQEVSVNIDVAEGSLSEKTSFSSVATIGGSVYGDTYESQFRTHEANLSFNKTFDERGVVTNITGVANFIMSGKEVISTTQIYDKSCCAVAAGSKFFVTGIEYKGKASPGGLASCCGVNFSADVPQSIGRLEAAVIDRRTGETVVPAIEEDGEDTVVFENSVHRSEINISGSQNGFIFVTTSPICSPADEPPDEPFFDFKICVDEPNSLLPWGVTP